MPAHIRNRKIKVRLTNDKIIVFLSTTNPMVMKDVIGMRIKNLRKLNGLSLEELAVSVGISKQMVSKYERGISLPSSDILIALAKEFNQKVDYFFRKSEIELGQINFRKQSTLGVKRLNALKEEIRIKIENYLFIENTCGISTSLENPFKNMAINSIEDVRGAAYHLKEVWQIGQDAIYNLLDLFENNNLKVIEIADETGKFDGLATVIDMKFYVIVVAKNIPTERKRFTLLHELGHLLLPIGNFEERQQEKYCNAFASEMLLSMANIKAEFSAKRHNITMPELIHVQEKYGISVPAVVYKLNEAEIISAAQLKKFFMRLQSDKNFSVQINASRYTGEESSNRFENLVYCAIAEEQITFSKASALLGVHLSAVKDLMLLNF